MKKGFWKWLTVPGPVTRGERLLGGLLFVVLVAALPRCGVAALELLLAILAHVR